MITKFIRKHLMNAYTSIPMLVCLLFVTWSSYGGHSASSVKLSGEEMFRGVFFAEGQFAELIPELKATQTMYSSNQSSVDERNTLIIARTQIIASIKVSNPHYFEDFKASIKTANPVLIKEKLMEGQEIITKNALRLSKLKESDLKSLDNFLAKEGKSVDKKALSEFMKKMSKDCFSNAQVDNSMGKGTCLLMYTAPCCVITPVFVISLTISNQQSKLMLEQMVCSICTVAPTVG